MTPEYAAGAAGQPRDLVLRNWRSKAEVARQKLPAQQPGSCMAPAFLMPTLAGVLPRDAIVVEEALTAAPALATFLPVHSPSGSGTPLAAGSA